MINRLGKATGQKSIAYYFFDDLKKLFTLETPIVTQLFH